MIIININLIESLVMKFPYCFLRKPRTVKLELDPKFLASLMKKGQIHAADFRCLDISSKQIVWSMLLSLAKSKLGHGGKLLEDQ